MAITLPAVVTGGAQIGFTTPTYTTAADAAVDHNIKQVVVSALGGTQAGVDAHSISRPFVIKVSRPKQFNTLGKPNPTTGLIANVPMNEYRVSVVKGVTPLSGQPSKNMVAYATIAVPAGADLADPANIRACISALVGTLNNISAGLGDTLVNGVL